MKGDIGVIGLAVMGQNLILQRAVANGEMGRCSVPPGERG